MNSKDLSLSARMMMTENMIRLTAGDVKAILEYR